ncbi:B-cell receptor-associated 31 [Brachionus plicatilis]|uniref:Endoplasmic reticulum transmembrane protein n=1 Tax=Brachionus plicatilis TaxID=10195 RepID=A0A3M7P9H7_BRAPC|nr:B-cell receptor-associated 31 [Brachionus plicatilis]
MSLQWTLVASFLYIEIAFIILLLLPIISPTRWQSIFKSRLVAGLTSYARLYFNGILIALVFLLIDAIREITRHKTKSGQDQASMNMEQIKEFRAQRNFYISGTALILWFVLKRLIVLIQRLAQLNAENKAILKQAESASKTARDLMDASKKDEEKSKKNNSEIEQEVMKKQDEIKRLNKELEVTKLDLEAMKRQSENLAKEYDNLSGENSKLTRKLEQLEYQDQGETKKDN